MCFGGEDEDGGKALNSEGYCTDFCADIYDNSTLYCGTGPKYENQNSTFLIDCTECKQVLDPKIPALEKVDQG